MQSRTNVDFKVWVQCFTFNHAPYIVDTMNGFAMQKTNFPFVCTIVDDASTDGEQLIIKKYLEQYFDINDTTTARREENEDYIMILARHKTNHNCFFSVLFLKYNHYSIRKSRKPYFKEWESIKYIAKCEGDDYWTDPLKLQIQSDVLETHPEMCMCTHGYEVIADGGLSLGPTNTLNYDGILDVGKIIENVQAPQTATFFYRNIGEPPSFFMKLDVGDYPLRVFCAISGGIYYVNKVMSSYRRYSESSWTSKMTKNKERYTAHINKLIVFAQKLDTYTNGKYHDNVLRRLDYCNYLLYINNKQYYKAFCSDFFRAKSLKEKLITATKSISPKLWYIIQKMYMQKLS